METVFVERIVSPDEGQISPSTGKPERPNVEEISKTVQAGETLVIQTGEGAPEGFGNAIYDDDDVEIERVIMKTDAGKFEGGCGEARES